MLDRAIDDFNQAIRLNPNVAALYVNRGATWSDIGDHDRALADYDRAIRLDPKFGRTFSNRGLMWQDKGDYVSAIADFEEAIRLDAKASEGLSRLAWLLATCPAAEFRNGRRALELALKHKDVTGENDPNSLTVLAAAHAEAGDFDAAVRWQEEANVMFKDSSRTIDLEKGLERLKLYRDKKPYRDQPTK
jgi:tetratricopeptide (TPR) repeat protein